MITAYIQALSLYLLEEKPDQLCQDLYYLYPSNRFQASRYGFEGNFVNPYTSQICTIQEDMLATIKKIEPYANRLNSMIYLSQLMDEVTNMHNDTTSLRQTFKQVNSLPRVVAEQCLLWAKP